MSMRDMDLAAIKRFENDLRDMTADQIKREIRDAENQLEEIEPWLEALYAKKRQMAADSAEALAK